MSVCAKSFSYLLQGDNHEGVERSSYSPLEDVTILTCSKPMDRRVKPQHEEPLKCPRCDSNHTKFCYYNNYSLTQPRYFCKACRRYWTKGGSLRNVPVGGGCRKNKRSISRRSREQSLVQNFRFSHGVTGFNPISGSRISDLDVYVGQTDFTGVKYNTNLVESRLTDGSEKRRNYIFDGDLGFDYGHLPTSGFQNFYYPPPPLGFSMDGSYGSLLENTETSIVAHKAEDDQIETKPNTELLPIEWPEQSYSEIGKNTSEYANNLGSWSSTLDGYGLL